MMKLLWGSLFFGALLLGELPEGKYRELVVATCTSCHAPELIEQQRLNRKDWDNLITWMQEKQNLWPLTPEVRVSILDYLVSNFGEDRLTENKMGLRPVNPLPRLIQ